MSAVLQARARLGMAVRSGDAVAAADARRDLAASKIEQYVHQVIAEAPPLTDEQRDRLARIFRASREVREP